MPAGEIYLRFGPGLTDNKQTPGLELGEGSLNFYPSEDGEYLENYPGRTDWFRRPSGDPPASLGTPPSTATDITRLFTFRDGRGREHVVYVQGSSLYLVVGNGFRLLYTFAGRSYDGKFYPTLFVHEAKLIIVNFGDPVLMWDGVENVHPLGVQEAPMAPDVRSAAAPASDIDYTHGPWRWQSWWWPGQVPVSGPGDNYGADGTTRVDGHYQVIVQFYDKYGNKGRISPPSRMIQVTKETTFTPAFGTAYKRHKFLYGDYLPPMVEDHIVGAIVGRTLSLNPDGGLGAVGVYYKELTRDNVSVGRFTLRSTDAVLTAAGLMDTVVGGPPQASIGCSWGRRTWLAGLEDENVLAYSDQDYFGQYRSTNRFRANDHIRAVAPMGDRLAIITRSSTEILYDDAGTISILEQDFDNGSMYGRSFVEVGNGTIFGLWNKGFGYYDGQKHQYIESPYYIKSLYQDSRFFVHSALKVNDWYLLSVRKDMVSAKNNYLLVFHFPSGRWYILDESVYDLCWWRDGFLGCADSIYELFKGSYSSQAKINIRGLIPPESSPLAQRTLADLRLLMEPSSSLTFDVNVEGEFNSSKAEEFKSQGLPSKQAASRMSQPVSYCNKVNLTYASNPEWISPRDVWLTPQINKVVSGYSHTVKLTFPVGHQVRIKALGMQFGADSRSEIT